MEFWVDGQLQFEVPAGKAFSWDTRTVEDGSHEIRLVAIEDSGIETRSFTRFHSQVFNHDHRVEVNDVSRAIRYEDNVAISGTAPGAERVEIFRGYRRLGAAAVSDSRWQLAIPAKTLGHGAGIPLCQGILPGRINRPQQSCGTHCRCVWQPGPGQG